jgi:uncharacterized SAM-binding protein YcdF (DUF218 family)
MFVVSKLLSAITQPIFWLGLWWILSLLLLGLNSRWYRPALGMLWAGLVLMAGLGFTAMPDLLLRKLESRYQSPSTEAVSRHVGMIVLGGATQHPDLFLAHGQVPLGESAERMTVPIGLMRQHPKIVLLFSGGEGRLLATGTTEGELARAFYQEQGVDMTRVNFEVSSRTTRENAIQVAKLLGAKCRQPWLLVTSAWHMVRSMEEFEAVGCNVTAYPVDFRTSYRSDWTDYSLASSLVRWQTALHEWLGIFVYRLTR